MIRKKKLQIKKTKKLFYNKYPYKVSTQCKGACFVTRRGIEFVLDFCESNRPDPYSFRAWHNTENYTDSDKKKLRKFSITAEPFIKAKGPSLLIRTEGNQLNFFTNDLTTYQNIQKSFEEWITEITEPGSTEDLDFLLSSDSKKILVDALPHDIYQYRIYVKNTMHHEKRLNFKSWFEKYPEGTIRSTRCTNLWLTGKSPYFREPFLYVKNKPTLSMIGLYISGDIKKIEEFVLRDTLIKE